VKSAIFWRWTFYVIKQKAFTPLIYYTDAKI